MHFVSVFFGVLALTAIARDTQILVKNRALSSQYYGYLALFAALSTGSGGQRLEIFPNKQVRKVREVHDESVLS